MASQRHATPLLALATAALAVGAVPAAAQTMVEYGHMAAGSAKAAASLRKASPATTFGRMHGARSGAPVQDGRMIEATAGANPLSHSATPSAITVLRLDWGAPAPSEPASDAPDPQTVAKKIVLEADGFVIEATTPPDLAAKGLSTGMDIAQVSMILGDPAVGTSGLAGRGYDEKRLYRLSEAWQVMVFAARGSVTAFLTSPAPKNSSNRVLSAGSSVIP